MAWLVNYNVIILKASYDCLLNRSVPNAWYQILQTNIHLSCYRDSPTTRILDVPLAQGTPLHTDTS